MLSRVLTMSSTMISCLFLITLLPRRFFRMSLPSAASNLEYNVLEYRYKYC